MQLIHPSYSNRRKTIHAFTLIEMLVVISIIAILASLAFGVGPAVIAKAHKVKTQAAIKDLQVAIKNYQVEYNRYPVAGSSGADQTIMTDAGSGIISILMGLNDDNLNTREIKFLDLPMAKGNRGGLINSGSTFSLADGWARPYHIILDTDYNNRVRNPDVQNEDTTVSSHAPSQLPTGVAIYSEGPDTQEFTKDDIVSWR